ncbi:hypothetical protein [Leucobacter massiliensis]|uniref:hypothetical protein n=1 Tax=Leucobacter massiliensis TaxID=1686285 RepID=UPI0011B217AF|nr:hypothetical protein [Leucobacter massiliensis]
MTWTLILLALCKAVITLVLLGPGERPGLLLENNFELALFCGLAAVVYRFLTGKHQFLMLACLGLLVVLSGSRSGVVAFFVLYVFAVAQSRLKVFAKYLSSLAVLAVAWVVVEVFLSRAGASGAIDRLNFLAVFLDETRNWGPLEWVLGTVAITPLSGAACRSLSYYESLFSSADDGTCYSVILHAFLLRVLFDSGILGLLLAFGGIFVLMRRAKVSRLLSLTLLGIAIANSASVSGPNNPYVLLPILLAILLAPVVPGALTGPHPWPSIRYSRPSRNSSRYPIRSG